MKLHWPSILLFAIICLAVISVIFQYSSRKSATSDAAAAEQESLPALKGEMVDIETSRGSFFKLTFEGHEYIVAQTTVDTIYVLHSASCPCGL
jgi:hypothetical protein